MKPFDHLNKIKQRFYVRKVEFKNVASPTTSTDSEEPSGSNQNIVTGCKTLTIDTRIHHDKPVKCLKRRGSQSYKPSKKALSDSEREDNSGSDFEEEKSRACIAHNNEKPNFMESPKKAAEYKKINLKIKPPTANLNTINQDSLEQVVKYLSPTDQDNLLFVCKNILENIKNSSTILLRFTLRVNRNNFQRFVSHRPLHSVPLKNISFDFNGFLNFAGPVEFLSNFKISVEHLHIKDAKFKSFKDFSKIFGNLKSIKSLKFENCWIEQSGNEALPALSSLRTVSFNKCNDNLFKAFRKQNSLTKIEVINPDWTWNGFPHDILSEICKNCKNFEHLVLNGAGTGSYFDSDEFPYKVKKLESSMITFHWYVGIKTERVSFLRNQIGHLKDLKIHQLPNDFDGGRVVKFILEKMNLETFYYGDIPLILKGKKQHVTEFAATEIQIRAAMELIQQFPTITSYCLILSSTDIASDEIEKAINPRNDLFRQLRKFEVIDNSKYRGLFGVFLGLLKNLVNIQILSLKTQDRNINVLLEESLPYMTELRELYLPSMASRSKERLNIIKNKAPGLQKLSLAEQFVEEAKAMFGNSVEICGIRNE